VKVILGKVRQKMVIICGGVLEKKGGEATFSIDKHIRLLADSIQLFII